MDNKERRGLEQAINDCEKIKNDKKRSLKDRVNASLDALKLRKRRNSQYSK